MGNSESHEEAEAPVTPVKALSLLDNFTCPNCLLNFEKGSPFKKFNQHVSMCITNADDDDDTNNRQNETENQQLQRMKKDDYMFEKVPDDEKCIHFSWSRVLKKEYVQNLTIILQKPEQVRNMEFQEKLAWFRSKLETKRITWEHGCEWIKVERHRILETSIDQVLNADMKRQVKIDIDGQKASDAGGILRQWIGLVTEQIFDLKPSLFSMNDSDEIAYKLRADPEIDDFTAKQVLGLLGSIIGKAIFEKIPLTTYLDRTVIRQLSGNAITLSDVYSYDKGLYFAWKSILDDTVTEDYQLYFSVVYHTSKGIEEVQLIPNGKNIAVDEKNKKKYIEKCINEYCRNRVRKYLDYIKDGLHKVIPEEYLSVFRPHELEMIMYGIPFIDLADWRANTQYEGAFHKNHKTILWFWAFMKQLTQEKLSKILHFCTGSSRTPIHGFRKLETNRGNYGKFTIISTSYNPNDPYPKGHTCFNRLQMPVYPTKQLVRKSLQMLTELDFAGIYGLD